MLLQFVISTQLQILYFRWQEALPHAAVYLLPTDTSPDNSVQYQDPEPRLFLYLIQTSPPSSSVSTLRCTKNALPPNCAISVPVFGTLWMSSLNLKAQHTSLLYLITPKKIVSSNK